MANNTVLQWQSHVTDSTDREVILGNLDLLEQFAGAINGGDKFMLDKQELSLSKQFEDLRNKIKNGTIKPTEWKTSTPFTNITKGLTNASSGKIEGLDGRLKTAEGGLDTAKEDIKKRLESSKFDEFKTDEFQPAKKRIGNAETKLSSHDTTLTGYGTRIGNAEDDIKKKLGISEFEKFQTGDTSWKDKMDKKVKSFASSSELENLRTLLSNEISHWTRATKPLPLDEYKTPAQLKSFTQPWEEGANADNNYIPERHIGDLCTVIGATQPDKGVSYRFVKHPDNNTYTWTKVIDNDGVKALSQHSQFITTYNKRQKELDKDSKNKQSSIDALKKRLGFQDGDPNKSVKELLEEQREKWRGAESQYKVVVSTKGYIKDGVIVNGGSNNGTPVIVHTAHVYDYLGHEKTIEARNKLTWTINKGRTTKPVEKTVTGLVCEVSQDQFVNDGTNPHYYNIELNSTF